VQIASTWINAMSNEKIMLYPIPAKDYISISSTIELSEIVISDINGKTVKIYSSTEEPIDLSHLASGIYLLSVKNSEGNIVGTQKLIKE